MMSSSSEHFLSMALAYLEIGKYAALAESELKCTVDYENAVAYQAFHAVELFLKYMIHRKEGSCPHGHELSELEKEYEDLYPDQSFIFTHPFDFGSYQEYGLDVGEKELTEKHMQKFKPGFMDQHLRYPIDHRTGGYSFSFDACLFDDLKGQMLSISGVRL